MENNNITISTSDIINKPYEVHQYEHRIVSFEGSPPPYYNYHYCIASFDTKEEAYNYIKEQKSATMKVLYRDPLYGLTNI